MPATERCRYPERRTASGEAEGVEMSGEREVTREQVKAAWRAYHSEG